MFAVLNAILNSPNKNIKRRDEYAALLHYCESRDEDRDAQEIHWENVWMDINNEWADNQPKPF